MVVVPCCRSPPRLCLREGSTIAPSGLLCSLKNQSPSLTIPYKGRASEPALLSPYTFASCAQDQPISTSTLTTGIVQIHPHLVRSKHSRATCGGTTRVVHRTGRMSLGFPGMYVDGPP